MTDHDPLCPFSDTFGAPCMYCALIAKARTDERERIAQAIEASLVGATFANQYTIFAMQDAARIARNALRAGSA